ncbi:MAG: hypothetical protein PWQ18_262 [Clostridia bacterium]|nr:hypothetical protein [Clostridia bacterium]
MKKALCFCLVCFLLSRAIVLGSACLTFYSFDKPPAPPGYVESGQGPLDEKPLNVLYFYDATHYMKIAQEGYTLAETPWFPLYPLPIKLFGGTPAAGVLLSNLLFFIGLVGLYKLAEAKGVLLASVSTIGLVFSAIHSESLFFCLAAWFIVALAAGKKEWAGILAGLAALSRPPGWALAAYLAVAAVGELVRGGTGKRFKSVLAPPVIAGVIGLAYPVFLLCHYGLADILAVRREARTFMPSGGGPSRT